MEQDGRKRQRNSKRRTLEVGSAQSENARLGHGNDRSAAVNGHASSSFFQARKQSHAGHEEGPSKVEGERVWKYVCTSQLLVKPERSFRHNLYDADQHEKTRRTEVTVYGRKVSVLITCEAAVVDEWIGRQSENVYGVDVEWKPNRIRGGEENKVALVQISGEKECLIVQMLFLDRLPLDLVKFLEDPKRKMGGVGIIGDAKKLRRDYDLHCDGLVELTTFAAEKLGRAELKNVGLKAMANLVIGLSMDKPKRVTMSDWAKRNLDRVQVNYACVDAWVSYAILQNLLST